MSTLKVFVSSSIDSNTEKQVMVSTSFTGQQFLQIACVIAGIPFSPTYAMRFINRDGNEVMIQKDAQIGLQGVTEGSKIYILDPNDNRPLPRGLPGMLGSINASFPGLQAPSAFGNMPTLPLPPDFGSATPQLNLADLPPPPNVSQVLQAIDVSALPPPPELGNGMQQFGFDALLPPPPDTALGLQAPSQIVEEMEQQAPKENEDSEDSEVSDTSDSDLVIHNRELNTSDFETASGLNLQGGKRENCVSIYTYYQFNVTSDPPVEYEKSWDLEKVLSIATQSLSLKKGDYYILLKFNDNDMKWFERGKYIEDYGCFDGMQMMVFKKESHITVTSNYFETFKYKFNTKSNVLRIVVEIAKEKGIKYPIGFTLFKQEIKKKGDKEKIKDVPLDLTKDLPSQVKEFKELKFKRRFFIFSRELFDSEEDTWNAFLDAKEEIHTNTSMYLPYESAVEVAAYASIAISEHKRNEFDIMDISNDVSKLLPRHYPDAKTLGMDVRKFLDKVYHGKYPNEVNAIRLFLRTARMIPGFAMQDFSCYYENDKGETSDPLRVLFSPHCMTIIYESNQITDFRVPYNDIITITKHDQVITVKATDSSRVVVNRTIVSKHADEIYSCIYSYQDFIRQLLMKRAYLRFQGKYNGPINPNDTISVEVNDGFHDKNPQTCEFDRNLTGRMLMTTALLNIGIDINSEEGKSFNALVTNDDLSLWVIPDVTCAQMGIISGSKLFFTKSVRSIKITLSDGSENIFKLNITKKTGELIKEIFTLLKQPYVYGYSLFYSKQGKLYPLDSESSPPEQTKSFNNLFFKRRYFTLSKDDLQNEMLSMTAFCDCKAYILNEEIQITEQQAIQLAILAQIIEGRPVEKLKKMGDKDFIWDDMFPLNIPVKSSLKKNFLKAISTFEPIEKKKAIKHYISIARELPFFGGESYPISYRVQDSKRRRSQKSYTEAVIKICPLSIYVLDTSGKVITNINWLRFKSLAQATIGNKTAMKFTFKDEREQDVSWYILSDYGEEITTMINGTIYILNEMTSNRNAQARAKEKEIRERRHGGWIDEKGVKHSKMVDLYAIKDLEVRKKVKMVWIDIDTKYHDLLKFLKTKILGVDKKDQTEYGVMIEQSGCFNWLKPGDDLSTLDPQNQASIYILNTKPTISVQVGDGEVKQVVVDITQNLDVNVYSIAKQLQIQQPLGFTLYTPSLTKDHSLVPLQLDCGFPEQICDFKGLVFRRRFFVITKLDFTSEITINQLFYDIRTMVLSGVMDISIEKAIELAYYQFIVIKGIKVTEKDVPDSLEEYIPRNIKMSRSIRNEVKRLVKAKSVASETEARNKFIALARSLPTFGCERYQCLFYEKVKNKIIGKECLILITPLRIIIIEREKQRVIANINYEFLLKVEELDGKLCFYYCDNKEQSYFIDVQTMASKQIKSVISTYLKIRVKLLKIRAEGFNPNIISTSDRVSLLAGTIDNSNNRRPITLDIRLSGKQLQTQVAKYINLNTKNDYACLLIFTPKDTKWVSYDNLLGEYRPFDGVKLDIYNRFTKIKIQLSDGTKTQAIVDVMKNIHDLTKYLAKRFNIYQSNGYTLYVQKEDGSVVPLEATSTIPQQADIRSQFIFKRRFFMVNKGDIESHVLAPQLQKDYHDYIMSGEVKVSENEALELATYQVYIDAENPEDPKKNPITDITKYLPPGVTPKPYHLSKLNSLLMSVPNYTKVQAAQQYMLLVRGLGNFASKTFNIKLKEENPDPKKKDKEPYIYTDRKFVITSENISLMSGKRTIAKYSIRQLYRIQSIQNILNLHVPNDKEETIVLSLISEQAREISSILTTFKQYIIPEYKKREKLHETTILDPENDERTPSQLPFWIYTSLDVAKPVRAYLDPDSTLEVIKQRLARIFCISDASKYSLFTYTQDGQIVSIRNNMEKLSQLRVCENCRLYFMNPIKNLFIQRTDGFVTQIKLDITDTVSNLCSTVSSHLDMGFDDGFTFYSEAHGSLIPLNTVYSIPVQTSNIHDMYFKRRFYVFTDEFIADKASLSSLYCDCKEAILKSNIQATEQSALELAIFSIYAEIKNISDFHTRIKQADITSLLPSSLKLSNSTFKEFISLSRTISAIPRQQAINKYIATCCELKGFGIEPHFGIYKLAKQPSKPCIIAMSPYSIEIRTKDDTKSIETVLYNRIMSSEYNEDRVWHIRFYNNHNQIVTLNLSSPDITLIDTYYQTINNYIDTYGEIMSIDEFVMKLLGIEQKHGDNGGNDAYDNHYDDILAMSSASFNLDSTLETFNDINIKADYDLSNECQQQEQQQQQLEEDKDFDQLIFHIPADLEMASKNMGWRASIKGLMISRALRVIQSSEQRLQALLEWISTGDSETLIQNLSMITDDFGRLTLEEIGDNTIPAITSITAFNDVFEKLKDFSRNISSTEELSLYSQQLTEYFGAVITAIGTAKNNNIFLQQQEMQIHQEELTPISRLLLLLSESLEDFISITVNNPGIFYEVEYDINAVADSLMNTSVALTNLAESFSKVADTRQIEQQVTPQIAEVEEILGDIEKELVKAPQDSNDFAIIAASYNNLKGFLQVIKKAIEDYIAFNKESKSIKNQLYTGNKRALNTTASILVSAKPIIDELMTNSYNLANNNLDKEFSDLRDQYLKNTILLVNSIKANINSQVINDEDLYCAIKAFSVIKTMQNKLVIAQDPVLEPYAQLLAEKIFAAEQSIAAISTINVNPWTIGQVIDDIDILTTNFNNVNTSAWQSIDPSSFQIAQNMLSICEEAKKQLLNCVKELEDNPVNGIAVHRAQLALLTLKSKSPEIEQAINVITKNTNDYGFQVIFERLSTDLDFSLIENLPSDELAFCQHVMKYHKAQHAFADILNLVARLLASEAISSNIIITSKLNVVKEFMLSQYKEIALQRKLLHETPFDKDTLYTAAAVLDKSTKFVTILKTVSQDVADVTKNAELDTQMIETNKAINEAIRALKKAPLSVYRLDPTKATFDQAVETIEELVNRLSILQTNRDISTNEQALELIEQEKEWINLNTLTLKNIDPVDDPEGFYRMLEKFQRRVEKMPNRFRKVPKITQSADTYELTKDGKQTLRMILKATIPTMEMVLKEIKRALPALDDLQETLNSLQGSVKDQEALTSLSKWRFLIDQIIQILHQRTEQASYEYKDAMQDRMYIVSLLAQLKNVPIPFRKSLSAEEKLTFTKSMNAAQLAVNRLATCLRSVPTNGVVNIDMNCFLKLEKDAEISESIEEVKLQYETFKTILDSIKGTPQLINRKHTLNLLNEMSASINSIVAKFSQMNISEVARIEILSKAKDQMSKIVSSAELIAPIVGVTKLHEITKVIYSNTTMLHKLLSLPHLDNTTASQFEKEVSPEIQRVIEAYLGTLFTQRINQSLVGNLGDFKKLCADYLERLPKMKPRMKQKVCDDLYSKITSMIPYILDYSECQNLAEAMLSLADVCSRYTSLPVVKLSYTSSVQAKHSPVSIPNIQALLTAAAEYFNSTLQQLPESLIEIANDTLHPIIDHIENTQGFIQACTPAACKCISTVHQSIICPVLASAILTRSEADFRATNLEDLVINSLGRAAQALNQIKISMQYIKPESTWTNESVYNFSLFKKSLIETDIKLVLNSKSISACTIVIPSLKTIRTHLRILIPTLQKDENAKQILDKFADNANDFELWIQQTNLMLQNLFFSQVDSLAVKLEEINAENKELQQQINSFIRQCVNSLRNRRRLLANIIGETRALSTLMFNFLSTLLPQIQSLPNNEEVIEIVRNIERFKPLMKMWIDEFNNISVNKFRSIIESNTCYIIKNLPDCLEPALTNSELFIILFSRCDSALEFIDLAHSVAKGTDVETEQIATELDNLSKLIHTLYGAEKMHGELRIQLLQAIVPLLEKALALIEEKSPIDYTQKINIDVDTESQFQLDLITDPICLQISKYLLDYLEKLQKASETLPKVETEEEEKAANIAELGISQSLQDVSFSLIKLLGQETISMSDITSLYNNRKGELLIKAIVRFATSSVISTVGQKLMTAFPEASTTMSRENFLSEIESNITLSDFEEAKAAINAQITLIKNNEKLDQYQKRLTPEKAIAQLLLLRTYAKNNETIKVQIESVFDTLKLSATKYLEATKTIAPSQSYDTKRRIKIFEQLALTIEALLTLGASFGDNNMRLFKYFDSPEFEEKSKQPLTLHEIIHNQKCISKQIEMIHLPDSLAEVQSKLTFEEIAIQLSLIFNAIDSLDSFPVSLNDNEDVSVQGILKIIFEAQQAQATDSKGIFMTRGINSQLVIKGQSFMVGSIEKSTLMEHVNELLNILLMYNKAQIPGTTRPTDEQFAEAFNFIVNSMNGTFDFAKILEEGNQETITRLINSLLYISYAMNTDEFAKMWSATESYLSTVFGITSLLGSSTTQSSKADLCIKQPLYCIEQQSMIVEKSMTASIDERTYPVLIAATLQNPNIVQIIKSGNFITELNKCTSPERLEVVRKYVSDISRLGFEHIRKLPTYDQSGLIQILGVILISLRSIYGGRSEHKFETSTLPAARAFDCASLTTLQEEAVLSKRIFDKTQLKELLNYSVRRKLAYTLSSCLLVLARYRLSANPRISTIIASDNANEDEIYNGIRKQFIVRFMVNQLVTLLSQERDSTIYAQQNAISNLAKIALTCNALDEVEVSGIEITEDNLIKGLEILINEQKKNIADVIAAPQQGHKEIEDEYSFSRMMTEQSIIMSSMIELLIAILENVKIENINELETKSFSIPEIEKARKLVLQCLPMSSSPEIIQTIFSSFKPNTLNCTVAFIADSIAALHDATVKGTCITDKDFNIPNFDLESCSQNIKIPTIYGRTQLMMRSISYILRSLQSISLMPIHECKSIVAQETQQVIDILRKLLHHKGVSYTQYVNNLLEIIPQVAIASIRFGASLDSDTLKTLVINPTEIINKVIFIVNSSTELSKQEQLSVFQTSVKELYQLFVQLQAIASNGEHTSTIDALASLSDSMEHLNTEYILENVTEVFAIKARSVYQKKADQAIALTEQIITPYIPYLNQLHALQRGVYPELHQHLVAQRTRLNEIITQLTLNPQAELDKLTTIESVNAQIFELKRGFEFGYKNLLDSFNFHATNKAAPSIDLITRTSTQCLATAVKGLFISNCTNNDVLIDFINKFNTTTQAFIASSELYDDATASQIKAKRIFRSLNRLLNSLTDALEDADSESWMSKDNTPLGKVKTRTLQATVLVLQSVLTIIASKASSKITETFNMFVKQQIPIIQKSTQELEDAKKEVLQLNIDEDAAQDFTAVFQQFGSFITEFTDSASKANFKSMSSCLKHIQEAALQLIPAVGRMTDVVPQTPDLENADKLPYKFNMPAVPLNISLKPGEIAQYMKNASASYMQQHAAFAQLIPENDNSKLADLMLSMTQKMTEAIQAALCVSTTTLTLRLQTEMTNRAAELTTHFSELLEGLRNKFLLRGDWKSEHAKYLAAIEADLKREEELAAEVGEIAIREENARDTFTLRFIQVLKPLQQQIQTINGKIKEILSSEKTVAAEWAEQLLTLSSSIGSASEKVLFHAKEHCSPSDNIDSLLAFGTSLSHELMSVFAASDAIIQAKDETEKIVIERANTISKLAFDFTKQSEKSISPEELALRDALAVAARAASTLAASAQQVLEKKKAREEQAKAREQGSGSMAIPEVRTREYLLKKLHLEARVIMARMILERSEDKLQKLM